MRCAPAAFGKPVNRASFAPAIRRRPRRRPHLNIKKPNEDAKSAKTIEIKTGAPAKALGAPAKAAE